ncbi:MAG: hypothetical protein WD030_10520 [Pirellulales bacterium]
MSNDKETDDELRPEYEEGFWEGAVRGKYANRIAPTTSVVRLAPDVAASFKGEESVNDLLRTILRAMNDKNPQVVDPMPEDVGQFFRDSDILEVR